MQSNFQCYGSTESVLTLSKGEGMVVSNAGMACLSFHIIPINTGSVALWNCKPTAESQTLK